MKNFLKSVADYVFSFWTFILLVGFLFGWILISIHEQEDAERKQTLALTEACYSQGMVLVRTDAGQRCVLPQSLVKVK
jgi:hypothetical protein